MAITHVVVSDLHLGAANSLLTNVQNDGTIATGTPAPVLAAFGEALGSLLAGQPAPPTLVFAGDIFELALTPTSKACETFSDFIRMAFGGDRPMFAPDITYIAGNHDHHLWELARQHQYVTYVASTPLGTPLIEDWHVTHLFPANDLLPHDDRFVVTLANRATPDVGITVSQSYPNLGIVDPDGTRVVVVSHGHYTESIYRAMELLHAVLTPDRDDAESAWHIEGDNWAWVDFMWSTLGRSGDAGTDVSQFYEMLQSEQAMRDLAARVIDAVIERKGRTLRTRVEAWALRLASRIVISKKMAPERHHRDSPLSKDAERGLQEYLRLAVAPQLISELGRVPASATFVFGHTHKPFARTTTVDGFANPVNVFNTGGWVIDSKDLNPLQGAAAILIDDQQRVVALDLYRQGDTAQVHVVSLADDSNDPDARAFADSIRAAVAADSHLWSTFSIVAAAEVTARRQQLLTRIAADEADIVGRARAVAPRAPTGAA